MSWYCIETTVVAKVAVWFRCEGIDYGDPSPKYFLAQDYGILCEGKLAKDAFVFVVGSLFGVGIPICYYQILKHYKTVCLPCLMVDTVLLVRTLVSFWLCYADSWFADIAAQHGKLWEGLNDTRRTRRAWQNIVFIPCIQATVLVCRGKRTTWPKYVQWFEQSWHAASFSCPRLSTAPSKLSWPEEYLSWTFYYWHTKSTIVFAKVCGCEQVWRKYNSDPLFLSSNVGTVFAVAMTVVTIFLEAVFEVDVFVEKTDYWVGKCAATMLLVMVCERIISIRILIMAWALFLL